MQKSDEMIALGTLYNKIRQSYPMQEGTERVFKEKVRELAKSGAISKESAQDALYCFIPSERIKQIEEYKKIGQTKNKGYSSQSTAEKVESLIDQILSDDIKRNRDGTPYEPDPCSHNGGGRSMC